MSLGSPVKTPKVAPLPPEPHVAATAEAAAARRDLEERMKRAALSREKSVLNPPALARPVQSPKRVLSERLG
jgi:hypothetical protein